MNILFIITGSIAVSKCNEILKKLKEIKINVDCIVTNNAKKLISIAKLKKNITGNIYTDISETKKKMLHINLSRKNDLVVVCPATANTIAKFANGYGNNLASTTLLASNKPILLIPAMNTEMWENKINKKNINYLKSIGVEFIGPKIGKLKCGEYGIGRIEETNLIVKYLISKLKLNRRFKSKKCLITAGPTIENIDPVRYLSNYSSGKQGYEIASEFARSGANVILISGPTNLQPPSNVKLIKIKTADEMLNNVIKVNKNIDVAVFSAAVADFKIQKTESHKIRKNKFKTLKLIENVDILRNISMLKTNRPKYVVGFSAETKSIKNGERKLIEKKCNMIVFNKISNNNKVFGLDENKVSIITKDGIRNYAKTTKINCAKYIVDSIYNQIKNK
ncbi:bifunctional phosphopantothenoylcysteine decarboxylase/phosphopantothenate--cysteine ligase CoaBC [Pelagibacterales bacterium SAG-MED31]|nr:bifunctional phosphopantothenoylcysteine decarboxylase/phosphopantothenate--cysteine ligase CoaBC [Pelagibacterales bacterium SAG-MED31]